MTREQLAAVWREWVNDYLTIGTYADHHGLRYEEAAALLTLARTCHEQPHPEA
jgi:hypothetical protein